MWLYPVPALIAILGFLFILIYRVNSLAQIRYALVIVITGIIIFLGRALRSREWPFGNAAPIPAAEVGSN
jgi:hypothetical protein